MRVPAEAGQAAARLRGGRALRRRVRAALRLHRDAVVAVLLAAGIALMALHWA